MSLKGKKPKIIPAFLNSLSYNERKYLSYMTSCGVFIGAYFTWILGVVFPKIIQFRTSDGISLYDLLVMVILAGFIYYLYIKMIKFKKLIKLEPKVKQKKEQEDLK